MTQLVEDITIKITLNHCEGDSTVIGGKRDLREEATAYITKKLPKWLAKRRMEDGYLELGIDITFTNTGLYERAEVGGGDN
jgi:hypothetical protein